MRKQNSWWAWIIIIAIVIGGWYWWKNYYQPMSATGEPTANQVAPSGGGFPSLGLGGGLQSIIASILQDGTAEQTTARIATGESDLAKSISQGIGDLNQFYDENSY